MSSYANSLKIGNPFDKDVDLGPIQNAMQYAKVRDLLSDCRAQGYSFATGDDTRGSNVPAQGYFIPPTVIDNPPNSARIVTEEQFGPVIPVQPWQSEDDVAQRTNDTKTGLGATIWAKDTELAERIAKRLEVGSVYVNSPLRPDWRVYFSGQNESGFGGERGLKGLLENCAVQAVHIYK